MQITTITPIRRCWSTESPGPGHGMDGFDIRFDDGRVVEVNSAELLSYRRVQREVLRVLGTLWSYPPAEARQGAAAWQQQVGRLLRPPVTVPRQSQKWPTAVLN